MALPAVGTPTPVTAANMAEMSLSIRDRPAVVASVKLGFCKNYTVQTTLQTGIPEAHKALFSETYLTATASNSGVASAYRLSVEPTEVATHLLVAADASAEATRRLSIWSTQRDVLGYTGTPELMLESLGSPQTLTHSRFGLAAGVTGQIVGLSQDWLASRVTFEVLV